MVSKEINKFLELWDAAVYNRVGKVKKFPKKNNRKVEAKRFFANVNTLTIYVATMQSFL